MIERAITTHFPGISKYGDICEAFEAFWNAEKTKPCKPLAKPRASNPKACKK